ncbi:hypothetical protein [Herbaspirillum robiniae]|uniref:DUF2946 domain-containing protein n=1 Tax=Herbaspirillum robiniae TaxID=2014887 RepID=A0ABX2LZ36_9BURK|nr:hypothetical protein [Herbaspirillum robiniae]NUU02583.1 hypothetical protein [Herbaspirillum robiniae]
MILRAKIFLLWLLALAIPVQGFAAALQACAPAMTQVATQAMTQATTQAITQTTAPAQQDVHAMHGAQHGQHMQAAIHAHEHQAAHDMQAADTANASPAHDLSHHAQHKSASCSYCAACTTGAVLPLALNAPPTPDFPSREFIALPASGFVGYLPENPDRPPAFV